MLDWLNNWILALADPALGWLLRLPVDLALVIVAVGTGSIITFARLFTTNQDLLRRCDEDKKRLKELIREAKRQKDKEAVKRYRNTVNMIGLTTMRQEGWPLLAALLPIAILGTWCFQRLAFVPPRAGETVSISASFPVSAIGELVHIVPQAGLREVTPAGPGLPGRWIQRIVADEIEVVTKVEVMDPKTRKMVTRKEKTRKTVGGIATWQLQADAGQEPYRLKIRHKNCTVEKDLRVGQRIYAPDVAIYGADRPIQSVQIRMKPVKLFGLVPGIPFLFLPPWLVAYFLIAIPSVSLIKRVSRIH